MPLFDHEHTAETWNSHGCTLCESGQFTAAVEAFDRAIALTPSYCTAWNNRANALGGLNRHAEALAAYDKAVALNPTYHQAWFNRGKLLAEMGAHGNALASYDRAIALHADPLYLHAREDVWVTGKLFADSRTV
ncbi:MAG: tetratricopeptide repeat protein [Cyanobacteria bacterium Co-bin8]|nr:tetratricopeptide repeat protein [Cyanobacteria bacterium Co-bin8]